MGHYSVAHSGNKSDISYPAGRETNIYLQTWKPQSNLRTSW